MVNSDRLLLMSLVSKLDNRSALALYDLESSSIRYLQIYDFDKYPGRVHSINDLYCDRDKVVAVSPYGLLSFAVSNDGNQVIKDKVFILHEWLLGSGQQGCLQTVCSSSSNYYVSFNAFNAIDTLDSHGALLSRKYLWEIAPDLFPLPEVINRNMNQFQFGVVRKIINTDELGLVFSISGLNGGCGGALVAETGKVLLRTEHGLFQSVIHDDLIYFNDFFSNEIRVYPWDLSGSCERSGPLKTFKIDSESPVVPSVRHHTRGLVISGESVVCGIACYDRKSSVQVSSKIVEFDMNSSKQMKEHFFSDLPGLRCPQVFAMCISPCWINNIIADWSNPRFLFEDKEIDLTDCENNKFNFKNKIKTAKVSSKLNLSTQRANSLMNNICVLDSTNSNVNQDECANIGSSGLNCILTPVNEDICVTSSIMKQDDVNSCYGDPVITVDNVSLYFLLKSKSFLGVDKFLSERNRFWALKNVSFVVCEGETVGIIGRNGSGKSTLSLLCAGVYGADIGTITIRGRVHLLALGVGFKPDLTGRDNVYVSASMLGMSRKQIQSLLPDIESFAELGYFFDEPVRTYSSGMRSKLGFAVATVVQPEILIMDEAMSVGDKSFKDKAMARMRRMRECAKSIIIVSHNPSEIRKLCSRVIWMEGGKVMMDGKANDVANAYENFCKNPEKWLQRRTV